MNYSDSARIKTVLQNCWFSYEEKIENADIVIFDTCSVRQKSEDKITWMMQDVRKDQKIWITWCMIQHNLDTARNDQLIVANTKFKKWNFIWTVSDESVEVLWLEQSLNMKSRPHNIEKLNKVFVNHSFNPLFKKFYRKFKNLELFFRIDDVWFLPQILTKLWYDVKKWVDLIKDYTAIIPKNTNQLFLENIKTAFVPIQTWCTQFCSYCIVPYARWLERNRPMDEIITEVKHHLNSGIEEVVLLGQIVNKHPDFDKIVKEIVKLKWLKWLRYTSPYPTYYSDEILRLHECESVLCPQIHAPLQAGSDKVLKKMFRWYTSSQYQNFIDKVRWLKRDISITTDIIVWFCDEDDHDFAQTIDLVNHARFDMIYIWIYSPRPWTIAERKYEDSVPVSVKKKRWAELTSLLKTISIENNQKEIWFTKEFVISSIWEKVVEWYTDNLKNILLDKVSWVEYNIWDFHKAQIIDWKPFKLKGKII